MSSVKESLLKIIKSIKEKNADPSTEYNKLTSLLYWLSENVNKKEAYTEILHGVHKLSNLLLSYLEGQDARNLVHEDTIEFHTLLRDYKYVLLDFIENLEEREESNRKEVLRKTLFSAPVEDSSEENFDWAATKTTLPSAYVKNSVDVIYKMVSVIPLLESNVSIKNFKTRGFNVKRNSQYLLFEKQWVIGIKNSVLRQKNKDHSLNEGLTHLYDVYKREFTLVYPSSIFLTETGYSYYWVMDTDTIKVFSSCYNGKLTGWGIV